MLKLARSVVAPRQHDRLAPLADEGVATRFTQGSHCRVRGDSGTQIGLAGSKLVEHEILERDPLVVLNATAPPTPFLPEPAPACQRRTKLAPSRSEGLVPFSSAGYRTQHSS
jgi:hypothetical protein